MSVVVLMSGGIDSAVVALLAVSRGSRVLPLFIDYGQLAGDREWAAAQAIAHEQGLPSPVKVDLSGYGKLIPSGITDSSVDIVDRAFLPGRNALLLMTGASYAYATGADSVAIGLLSDDSALFPDQTNEFITVMEDTIRVALGWPIAVVAPLMTMTKLDVVRLGDSLDLRMASTYSCHGGDAPCGRCISCVERMSALRGPKEA